MIDLSGKVAIVTGAAGALGRAYAHSLAARGAAVVCNDLGGDPRGEGGSPALAENIAEEIRRAGGRAVANADSVATADGGAAIIDCALRAFGAADIVIANAGNQRNARFEDMTEADLDAVLAVHLKGSFFVTQAAYRHMLARGWGRIVLTASQSGLYGNPCRANYGAAKMGVVGLMNVVAQEAPPGIRINTVLPMASGSRMAAAGGDRPDADFVAAMVERAARYPHAGTPDYAAALVTWLASDACETTGDLYSIVRGHYARVSINLAEGWIAGHTAPTPEQLATHIPAIRAAPPRWEPRSGLDELDAVIGHLLDRRTP